MSIKRQWIRLISVLCVAILIFGVGFMAGTTSRSTFAQGATGQPAGTENLFAPFWEAWNLVHQRYVDHIDDQKLMEGAASGMMNALGDRHTAYMNPQVFESLNSDLTGSFEGIGATIKKDDRTGGILILSTISGSPARAGGLKSGDIIITVDGKDITPLNENDVVGLVRGPAGTPVKLGIFRQGNTKLVDYTITRARITIPVVESRLYEGNIGYIKLAEFSDNAMPALRKALRELDANSLKGLVFDLRDNPGGGLQTAIDVGSLFIKEGPLVIERGKPGTKDTLLSSTGKTLAPDVPMVVLINAGSASASELISGALQDHKRATIVGTTSFGKGSVQIWSALQSGGGVRITIAHFFTPNDHIVHERGITPDFIVPWNFDTSPTYDPQLAEAFWILRGDL